MVEYADLQGSMDSPMANEGIYDSFPPYGAESVNLKFPALLVAAHSKKQARKNISYHYDLGK